MKRVRFDFFRAVILLLMLASLAAAQGTGSIFGTVTDPQGLAVPQTTVTATLQERGTVRTAETDSQGTYVFDLLPIGTYTVSAKSGGFKQFSQTGIALTSNQNVRVDAQLDVGGVTESVTVQAEVPLVDSRSSVVGTLIDSRRVVDLPTNGRNVVALAAMLPGVANISAPQTFTALDGSGPTLSVAGSRPNQNLFLFDGAQFNSLFRNTGLNFPPPDALQEVKVLTNTFNAEYGRNGGAVINVVTKSGTNQLHGSAWEFLRNQDLNARNFFQSSTKPLLIQNQFGATAGGPIRRNRLFAFASYEGLRVRTGQLVTGVFPLTAAERSGSFTSAIKDPLTGQPFPGNVIPDSRIDPVSRTFLARGLMPLPSQPDGQYVTTSPVPQGSNNVLGRIDYNLGRHTIDGRYSYNMSSANAIYGNIPDYKRTNESLRSQAVTLGDTFAITPATLSETRISFNRLARTINELNHVTLASLGANLPTVGEPLPPTIVINGRVTLGADSPAGGVNTNDTFQFAQNIDWNRGGHTVKGGFQFIKARYGYRDGWQAMGHFTFNGSVSGNSAADFMLGKPAQMVVATPEELVHLQIGTYYYIQDDWRINRRLTLNLGLRYELPLPWVEARDHWNMIRVGEQSTKVPNAPLGLVFPGDAGTPRGFIATDKNNFAPRVGFAYDLSGKGRTVLRGAYGIFYETMNSDVIQMVAQPFRYSFTVGAPYSLSDPLRGQSFTIPQSVDLTHPLFTANPATSYLDPTSRTPYVQQYNINVQHEPVRDLVVQVGYVGKSGRKLMMSMEGNPAVNAPGATLGNIDRRRIISGFGSARVISYQGNSSYNSLQVEVNKRYSRNFSVQGAYTFSRTIDMLSGITVGAAVPNVFDLSKEVGLADFHAKHIASASWICDLPRLSSMSPILRSMAGNWQVNGLITLRSGMPFNVISGQDRALSGTPNQRPDVIGDPKLPDNRSRSASILAWFNRAEFALPATGTYGSAGRNPLLGPASASANLGLFKNFPLPFRENMRLQFRSEFFNVFNSVNFGNPNANLGAGANMGRITSAGGARVIQFALKFLY